MHVTVRAFLMTLVIVHAIVHVIARVYVIVHVIQHVIVLVYLEVSGDSREFEDYFESAVRS